MDKRKLRRLLGRLRKLPHWSLLVISVFFFIISVFALRANNHKMITLRDAVFVADEQDGDIEAALKALREHVHSHMNTSLTAGDNAIRPPIQLKYRYERLVIAAKAAQNTNNETIYTDAQNYCEQQISTGFSGSNRLQCIREYIDRNGVQTTEVTIPDDLYKFDFVSPAWSPDIAGLSLAAALLSLAAFVFISLSQLLVQRSLKKHHS